MPLFEVIISKNQTVTYLINAENDEQATDDAYEFARGETNWDVADIDVEAVTQVEASNGRTYWTGGEDGRWER